MPDRDVTTIKDLIYYQYAKIIARSTGAHTHVEFVTVVNNDPNPSREALRMRVNLGAQAVRLRFRKSARCLWLALIVASLQLWSPAIGSAQTHPSPQAGPAQKASLRIMPLGDSISFGTPEPLYGGYRHALGDLLAKDGYRINFVGSQKSGTGVIPDPDNEGHPGWTIAQIKKGIDTNRWLETYQPDIILLHIGTNDISHGNAASAPSQLSTLLDDILARLPRVRVIVAQIIPYRRGLGPDHQLYNAAVPGIVASKGPRVSVVDMQHILSKSDYSDDLHPNTSGYDKMARAWGIALRAAMLTKSRLPAKQKQRRWGRPSNKCKEGPQVSLTCNLDRG
jgi:lysophospholipase L1-like esterase